MDADDALTELGSVRRLMAEESEDDSEESDDLDLDPEGDDAMSFVESDETEETELGDESADPEEDLDDSVEIRPAVVSLVEAAASVKRGLAAEKARTIDGEGETDENGDNDDEAKPAACRHVFIYRSRLRFGGAPLS